MQIETVAEVYKKIVSQKSPKLHSEKPSQKKNVRKNSISIEEPFFGDSGKGRIATEFNTLLNKKKNLYSLRFNGGSNAGHEVEIEGTTFTLHQLPMAVISEGAHAILSRGVLVHPDDVLHEAKDVMSKTGGKLPAKLLIDQNAILSLDTHRAYETVLNLHTTGGRGSTGRGISPGYMSFYGRFPVFVKDLMDDNWKEIMKKHYALYEMHCKGFGHSISTVDVTSSVTESKKRVVGNLKEFLSRLEESREEIKKYVEYSMYDVMKKIWNDPKYNVTIEGSQGAGLDPFHGVYPDVTASRTTSHSIMDATYGLIHPTEIQYRVGVVKGPYMSSVGKRILPTIKDEAWEKWIQTTFKEQGRTTGRLRDIYPISIPMAQYLRRIAGFDYIAVTHLDASREDDVVKVITEYRDKKTKKEKPYLPFQYELDKLDVKAVEFKGWDGEKVTKTKKFENLPHNAKVYLSFLSKTIAPVLYITTGVKLGQRISCM